MSQENKIIFNKDEYGKLLEFGKAVIKYPEIFELEAKVENVIKEEFTRFHERINYNKDWKLLGNEVYIDYFFNDDIRCRHHYESDSDSEEEFSKEKYFFKKRRDFVLKEDCRLKFKLCEDYVLKEKPLNLEGSNMTRAIRRTSYVHKVLPFRIDSSIINDKTYEIELEIINEEIPKNCEDGRLIDSFIRVSEDLVGHVQSSHQILLLSEIEKLNSIYKRFFEDECEKNKGFIGVIPRIMQWNDIERIQTIPYAISKKCSGKRVLIIVDNESITKNFVYLMDRGHCFRIYNVKGILGRCENPSIFDGEYFIDGQTNEESLHIFDTLVFDGVDLRGDNKNNLIARIDLATYFFDDCDNVQIKEIFLENIFEILKKLIDEISSEPGKFDGIVFTPINDPYPKVTKWTGLFKWTPPYLNTLIMRVKHRNEKDLSDLYVLTGLHKEIHREVIYATIDYDEKLKDGCNYEFQFVYGKWEMVRERSDKKTPNHSITVEPVFESLTKPITREDLIRIASIMRPWDFNFWFHKMMNKARSVLDNGILKNKNYKLEFIWDKTSVEYFNKILKNDIKIQNFEMFGREIVLKKTDKDTYMIASNMARNLFNKNFIVDDFMEILKKNKNKQLVMVNFFSHFEDISGDCHPLELFLSSLIRVYCFM